MYHIGTQEDFDQWHNDVIQIRRLEDGIPSYRLDQVYNQHSVTAYSEAYPHPETENYVIWPYGDYPEDGREQLTPDEIRELGW